MPRFIPSHPNRKNGNGNVATAHATMKTDMPIGKSAEQNLPSHLFGACGNSEIKMPASTSDTGHENMIILPMMPQMAAKICTIARIIRKKFMTTSTKPMARTESIADRDAFVHSIPISKDEIRVRQQLI
jgi:hypothetical protein